MSLDLDLQMQFCIPEFHIYGFNQTYVENIRKRKIVLNACRHFSVLLFFKENNMTTIYIVFVLY